MRREYEYGGTIRGVALNDLEVRKDGCGYG